MRVPYLEARSRFLILTTLFCVGLASLVLLQPASAGVFTVPESQLLNTSTFPKNWGPAAVTRTDPSGPSVDFAFTGLTASTGFKDDFPVDAIYGQTPSGHGGDFTNLSGYTIVVENLSSGPIDIQNFIGTGYTGGSGTPPNDLTNDTFWSCGWTNVPAGQKALLYLNFGGGFAWNIPDNKVPHTGGGLAWPNGGPYVINMFDRGEVSAVGFEVNDPSGTNPNPTIRMTPWKLTTLSPTVTFVDDAWVGFAYGTEVYFPGDANPHYIGMDAFATIQGGIDGVFGSTVNVAAGTYPALVSITKALTLQGAGKATTIIDCSASAATGSVVTINITSGNVLVDGFTIKTGTSLNGINPKSTSSGSTITISHNKIEGFGPAATGDNFGLIAGYGSVASLVFIYNEIANCGSNTILIERHVGPTDVSYNTFDRTAGDWSSDAYFNMNYGGSNITSLQRVSHNTIDMGAGTVFTYDTRGAAVTFASSFTPPDGVGGFTNVEITDNVIYNVKPYRRGIGLWNGAGGTGADGNFTAPIIARNTITGTPGATGSRGIQLLGLVTGASITNNIVDLVDYSFRGLAWNGHIATGTLANHNSFTNISSFFDWQGTAQLDARYNWWGSASGPGSTVSGNVLYDPWIGKAGGENIVCDPDPQYLTNLTPSNTVDVKYLGGGSGLVYGYSVKFSWNSSKVTMTGVSQGPLLSSQGTTQFFTSIVGDTCRVDCVLMGAYPGVTGPGTMFTVSFTGAALGTSPVDVTVIKVRDKINGALSGFYEDDGLLVIDLNDPAVADVFIDNTTLSDTDDYVKDGDGVCVTATVTDDDPAFGIGNITADLSGLGGGSAATPDSYNPVSGLATWCLASVTCDPSDGTVTVLVTATDALGNVGTGSDDITADNTAPSGITGLAAVQQKSGNDGDGTTKITLTFTVTDPGDAHAVEVYRAGFGSYPEYDDGGGSEPAAPDYESLGSWALTGVDASGEKDETSARDYWYYVAFVKDIAGNASAVSNKTTGTLNYHLGDVAPGGTGDNYVTTNDISLLSGHYWTSLVHTGDPYNYLDVGPTTDYSTNGRPTTDDLVDFEDLMMFAINFTTVSLLANTVTPFEVPQLGLVVDEVSGSILRAHVMLSGNRQSVKGLHSAVSYDAGSLELVSVSRGGLVTSQSTQVFFEEEASGGQAQVDCAVMGSGMTLRGSGEVAVLEFRVLGDEATRPVLAAADLRDRNNKTLRLQVNPGEIGDTVSRSAEALTFGAYPNPFRGETQIALNVPVAGDVQMKVYDVNGRQVATLVNGAMEAGSHWVVWDGRADGGSRVAPGVYMAVVRMSGKEMTGKLFMLP
jgi:hypothetical protein